jgi:hypothetical protein
MEHVRAVREQRSTHPRRRPLRGVELGIAIGHDQKLGRRAAERVGQRYEVRRRGTALDVREIQERLDVQPRRLGQRWEERVVAVGVHRLLVVRQSAVLHADAFR